MGAVAVWILVYQWTQASRSPVNDDNDLDDDDLLDEDEPLASSRAANVGTGGTSSPS